VAGIAVGVVALAAATVFTAGATAAVVAGTAVTVSGAATAGATALGTVAGTIAAATGLGSLGAALGTTVLVGGAVVLPTAALAVAGTIQETRYALSSIFVKKKLDGRNTQVPSGYKLVETEESRKLSTDFLTRFIPKDSSKVKV
jgi:hypothetical protein